MALPAAAEAAHPALQVEEETLALLLAVVADVDAGGDLLRHDPGERLPPGRLDRAAVDRLPGRTPRVKGDQLRRTGQAAGVGGQNPLRAATHDGPALRSTRA